MARQVCSRSVLLRPTTYTTLNRSYAVIKPATPIFKKYPVPPVEEPSSLKTHPTHLPQLSKQLRYPLLHPNIDIQKEPYSQPLGGTEKLPFRFTRTTSNQLPIYTDFKQRDVKKEYTVLRKITGDVKVIHFDFLINKTFLTCSIGIS